MPLNLFLFCLSLTIQSIAEKNLLFPDNGKYGYLLFGLSILLFKELGQNTFIFSVGQIHVPAPLEAD